MMQTLAENTNSVEVLKLNLTRSEHLFFFFFNVREIVAGGAESI